MTHSDQRIRHSFHSYADSPLREVVEYIKNSPGLILQREVEEALLLFHYPLLLKKKGVASGQLSLQLYESIRRLNQEITFFKTLLNQIPITTTDEKLDKLEAQYQADALESDDEDDDEPPFNGSRYVKDNF